MVYIVPLAGYYQDYLNEVFLVKEWTPAHIRKAVFEEKHPAILGGMFAIWNDHAGNGISVKDIHHRVFPALQTLAVKTWTGKKPVCHSKCIMKSVVLSVKPRSQSIGKNRQESGIGI